MAQNEVRLLHQMKVSLAEFKNEQLGIRRLIDNLESLMNLLQDTLPESEEEWKSEFWQTWWILEELYSAALCRSATQFNDEEWDSIVNAVLKLEEIVQNKIKDVH